LLAQFSSLPFKEAVFQQYTARGKVVRYGEGDYSASSYGNGAATANPRRPFPDFLAPLRRKVALWLDMDESQFVHALCTGYQPGTLLGWRQIS